MMLRMRALRASRTAYLAATGAAGAVLVESNTDSERTLDVPTTSESKPTEVHDVEQPRVLAISLPDKLSIYPKATPELVLLDTPSPLELQIGNVRRELCGYYTGARTHVQGIVDRWIHIENMVETRIKSFRDPTEPLNPALLFTGISALTASIFARSRSLPTRFLLPPLSFLGAFIYFLPRTASRIGSYAEELEDRYIPKLGEVRRTGVAHGAMAVERLRESAKEGKETLEKGARSVVDAVEDTTGLKLGDVFGDGSDRDQHSGKDSKA
ncbi:hypothetical protein SCLCIDRAFT_1217663 [Scleroderma citrinum Foug A]|uniref:MICOS complex subunit n=1 Tax=Scleroderma citrinum Foug A TaxID=1036808 RepID=A0A0C3DTM4_9AGAM|nr:hypothetical protein SCLCIDRAFT_1217663 [Scleroderma citrinum Foug A]